MMTKTIRKALLVILILSSSLISFGQRDPMYTQYIFNMQTINPAYAGTWQSLGFIALSRIQWVSIKDAPRTQTFSVQTPFKTEKVGLGFNIVHDKIGMEDRLLVNFDYSYRLSLSAASSLRFGIKGGFTNYSNPLGLYTTYTPGDPNFQGYIDNKFMPNVGVGAFLYSNRYYLGLSVPKLVEARFKNTEDEYTTLSELREMYLSGGLVFDLSTNIKFKPTFLFKYAQHSPMQYDLSANFLFSEKLWLGAMYRSGDAIGVIAQWIVQNRFRIGYSADFSTTQISRYSGGIHEIMVSYEIDWKKFISPRYF
jgi:type IX secretion system PorP/SprF family membrane protein